MYRVVLVLLCLLVLTIGGSNILYKIAGGTDTNIERHPYQVSIEEHTLGHICGGVIITPKVVLTSANCLGKHPNSYRVRAGSTHRNTGGTVVNVKNYIFHNKYVHESKSQDYDIAAVEVINNFNFGRNIQAIKLIDIGTVYYTGYQATLTGWGITNSGYASAVLQVIKIRFVGYGNNCQRFYPSKEITKRMICFTEEGKGPCQFDEGGPLVGDNKLIGISSFSAGCDKLQIPVVYVDIGNQPIWEWIQQFLVRYG